MSRNQKFERPVNFTYYSDEDIITALSTLSIPLPKWAIDNLLDRISEWDCEEWSAELGHAVVNRLQRHS